MKRFRDPNVLLRHDVDSTLKRSSRSIEKPREKNIRAGEENVPETLFQAVGSVLDGEFEVNTTSRNVVKILRYPLQGICATRNYQLPSVDVDRFSSIEDIRDPTGAHECLRPILIGLSLTIRTFIHVVIFDSNAYRLGGGLYSNSVQIVSSVPTPEERLPPFDQLGDIEAVVFIFVVKLHDGAFGLVSVGDRTWFVEEHLKPRNQLLRLIG